MLDIASDLLMTYGYWAVLLLVAVESVGLPVPGETMLLTAAIYAGVTHQLNIALVIVAAAIGAIMGDNLGYLIGREGGYRLLRRYGRYIRLDERRLRLGEYLFQWHGGKVVFFGRFVAVLRMWAAFLAGTHRMPWRPFLVYNSAGGIVWATLMGVGGYALGHHMERVQFTARSAKGARAERLRAGAPHGAGPGAGGHGHGGAGGARRRRGAGVCTPQRAAPGR